MKKHLQEEIKEVLKNLGTATYRQLKDILAPCDHAKAKKITQTLKDLRKGGYVVLNNIGHYEYQESRYMPSPKLSIIWRAIRNSQRFTLDDIILLSGASRGYIKKFLLYLVKEEYLVQAGRKNKKYLYQITAKATPQVPPYTRKISVEKTENKQKLESLAWEFIKAVIRDERQKIKAVFKQLTEVVEQV